MSTAGIKSRGRVFHDCSYACNDLHQQQVEVRLLAGNMFFLLWVMVRTYSGVTVNCYSYYLVCTVVVVLVVLVVVVVVVVVVGSRSRIGQVFDY